MACSQTGQNPKDPKKAVLHAKHRKNSKFSYQKRLNDFSSENQNAEIVCGRSPGLSSPVLYLPVFTVVMQIRPAF
jgi:hypothetical protein